MGRPRAIESPERFDELVAEYIADAKTNSMPLTLTGMILHLGLCSRASLDEYKNYDGFSNSVKKAKLLIENGYENKLHTTTPTGPIFALKNFGWADRQDLNVAGQPDGAPIKTEVIVKYE